MGLIRSSVAAATRVLVSASSDGVYDALNPKGRRRRSTQTRVTPEDHTLTEARRDRLDSNALDVWRNMSLLEWMIRRTLDYCCLWDFQPAMKDDGINRALRDLMARDCLAANLDYVGRMDWDDHRRVAEALKILTGDMFHVPLRERRLQAIEGSYCRSPLDRTLGDRWKNGALLNRRGRVRKWNFREHNLFDIAHPYRDRQVSARNVWQHIQYEGRLNQIRGLAPIASILNECRDIYETFDYARAKVKLDQIFGLAIFHEKDDEDESADIVDSDGNEVEEGSEEDTSKPEFYDFGGGPVVMDRTIGEDVKMFTSNNPSNNTQEFLKLCIQVALKALDLPYNFFDEAHTNFFGSRAAWNLYERSCWARRQTQLRLHHRMTRWRLFQWTLPESVGGTGELLLPKSMSINDIRYQWVPRGLPWWKPAEELETNLKAVAAGLKTMQRVCNENDLGLYSDNLEQLRREQNDALEHGFVMQFNPAKLSASLQAASVTPTGGAKT